MKNDIAIDKEYTLSPESIDSMSELLSDALAKLKVSRTDALRLRLAAEDVMGIWADALGAETKCLFKTEKRLKRVRMVFRVQGKAVDPKEADEGSLTGVSNQSGILAALGVVAEYSYEKGWNVLSITPPAESGQGIWPTLLAIVAATALGLGLNYFAPNVGAWLLKAVTTPVFNALMRLLKLLAGPLVFCAVAAGIVNMSNSSAFGEIGKKLLGGFVKRTFLVVLAVLGAMIWFFNITPQTSVATDDAPTLLFELILSVVPGSIVAPFAEGNAMQIIFMAVCVGVGLLALSGAVKGITESVNQCNTLVQYLMTGANKVIPAVIFLCVFNLILSGTISNVIGAGKQMLCYLMGCAMLMAGYVLQVRLKLGVPVRKLLKMLAPTFLVTITTASSVAAFSEILNCTEKKMGLKKGFVGFAVPIGQVVFMPSAALCFLTSAFCIGEQAGVVITPTWVITCAAISAILAIAAPPIPGGALTGYTILFAQMGIPAENIAIALSMELILDYISTAANVLSLEMELMLAGDKLGMRK